MEKPSHRLRLGSVAFLVHMIRGGGLDLPVVIGEDDEQMEPLISHRRKRGKKKCQVPLFLSSFFSKGWSNTNFFNPFPALREREQKKKGAEFSIFSNVETGHVGCG